MQEQLYRSRFQQQTKEISVAFETLIKEKGANDNEVRLYGQWIGLAVLQKGPENQDVSTPSPH